MRYEVQVTGSRAHTRIYNEAGHLMKMRFSGYSVEALPTYCDRVVGPCKFNYRSEFSKWSGSWNAMTRRNKDGSYLMQMASANKNKKEIYEVRYKLGKFNFYSEFIAGSNWIRLIKVTTP